MNPWYVFLALGLWFLFGVVIAYLARQRLGEGMPDFFLANRKLSGFISGMTYSATTYSAFMMVALVGYTYSRGVVALGFEMTYLMYTTILLLIFAPRFWVAGKNFDYITPPELLAGRYQSKWVGIIASIICLVMLIPYASAQLMGIGYLLSGLTPDSFSNMYLIGVLLAASFSTIASLVAGMKSVSWTDAFQALTMLFASIALLLFVFYHFFGSPVLFVSTVSSETPELLKLNWDFKVFVGLSLPWAFFAVTNPQVSQRMFVSDSPVSLKRMIIYFSIFGFIYTLITTLLGLSIANIGGLSIGDADQAMPALLSNIPIALGLVVFVSIFAAATSTLGSIILTLSSIGSRDLIKNLDRDIPEGKELLYGKLLIVGIILVCVIFANLKLNLILVLSSMASGGLLVMAPTIIGTFFWKRSTAEGALSSMSIGGIVTASLYISGWYPLGWWPSVWGLIVTVALYVGISYMTEPPEHTEKFLEKIEKGMENNGFK